MGAVAWRKMMVDYVTCMVLLLRQSGESIRGPKSPTRERDDSFTRAKNLRWEGLERADRSLWSVASPSLSLSAASPTSRFPLVDSRPQKRFHRQASATVNPGGSAASPATALFDQRLGRKGPAGGIGAAPISWLNRRVSDSGVVKSTIGRIVMDCRKFRRCIDGWCLGRHLEKADPRLD